MQKDSQEQIMLDESMHSKFMQYLSESNEEVLDYIKKRGDEIKKGIENEVYELINHDDNYLPELNDIKANREQCGPNVNCFPNDVFTTSERLQLLYANYAYNYENEEGDSTTKSIIRFRLRDLIRSKVDALPKYKYDVLIDSISINRDKNGLTFIDVDVLITWIFRRLINRDDFDKIKGKIDNLSRQGLSVDGLFINPEDIAEVGKGGFSDIAGMYELKERLQSDIIDVLREPERARKLGITLPNGMLLYGPPGCGKTVFAMKLAEEAGCNFVYVDQSDIGSKFVHETEGNIAKIFSEAEKKAPSIIFFDEVEAMIPQRNARGAELKSSEVNEFLTQLNHCGQRGIFVIGATNRPNDIDPAALRSGRLEMKVYLPVPDYETRVNLFIQYLHNRTIRGIVHVDDLAKETEGYISADIKKIVDLAAREAFRKRLNYISMEMLEKVIKEFKPSVSKEHIKEHEAIRDKFEGRKPQYQRIGFC